MSVFFALFALFALFGIPGGIQAPKAAPGGRLSPGGAVSDNQTTALGPAAAAVPPPPKTHSNRFLVEVISASGPNPHSWSDMDNTQVKQYKAADTYVILRCNACVKGHRGPVRTTTKMNTATPRWNEEFYFEGPDSAILTVAVFDNVVPDLSNPKQVNVDIPDHALGVAEKSISSLRAAPGPVLLELRNSTFAMTGFITLSLKVQSSDPDSMDNPTHSVASSGETVHKLCGRVRKNWADMDKFAKRAVIKVMLTMKQNGWFTYFARKYNLLASQVTGRSLYLPFHRAMIYEFESIARRLNPSSIDFACFAMPYWEWSAGPAEGGNWDDDDVFARDAFGPLNNGLHKMAEKGFLHGWSYRQLDAPNDVPVMREPNREVRPVGWASLQDMILNSAGEYAYFREHIETLPASAPHFLIGGESTTMYAAADPIFFLYQTKIDQLFDSFQGCFKHFEVMQDDYKTEHYAFADKKELDDLVPGFSATSLAFNPNYDLDSPSSFLMQGTQRLTVRELLNQVDVKYVAPSSAKYLFMSKACTMKQPPQPLNSTSGAGRSFQNVKVNEPELAKGINVLNKDFDRAYRSLKTGEEAVKFTSLKECNLLSAKTPTIPQFWITMNNLDEENHKGLLVDVCAKSDYQQVVANLTQRLLAGEKLNKDAAKAQQIKVAAELAKVNELKLQAKADDAIKNKAEKQRAKAASDQKKLGEKETQVQTKLNLLKRKEKQLAQLKNQTAQTEKKVKEMEEQEAANTAKDAVEAKKRQLQKEAESEEKEVLKKNLEVEKKSGEVKQEKEKLKIKEQALVRDADRKLEAAKAKEEELAKKERDLKRSEEKIKILANESHVNVTANGTVVAPTKAGNATAVKVGNATITANATAVKVSNATKAGNATKPGDIILSPNATRISNITTGGNKTIDETKSAIAVIITKVEKFRLKAKALRKVLKKEVAPSNETDALVAAKQAVKTAVDNAKIVGEVNKDDAKAKVKSKKALVDDKAKQLNATKQEVAAKQADLNSTESDLTKTEKEFKFQSDRIVTDPSDDNIKALADARVSWVNSQTNLNKTKVAIEDDKKEEKKEEKKVEKAVAKVEKAEKKAAEKIKKADKLEAATNSTGAVEDAEEKEEQTAKNVTKTAALKEEAKKSEAKAEKKLEKAEGEKAEAQASGDKKAEEKAVEKVAEAKLKVEDKKKAVAQAKTNATQAKAEEKKSKQELQKVATNATSAKDKEELKSSEDKAAKTIEAGKKVEKDEAEVAKAKAKVEVKKEEVKKVEGELVNLKAVESNASAARDTLADVIQKSSDDKEKEAKAKELVAAENALAKAQVALATAGGEVERKGQKLEKAKAKEGKKKLKLKEAEQKKEDVGAGKGKTAAAAKEVDAVQAKLADLKKKTAGKIVGDDAAKLDSTLIPNQKAAITRFEELRLEAEATDLTHEKALEILKEMKGLLRTMKESATEMKSIAPNPAAVDTAILAVANATAIGNATSVSVPVANSTKA